MVVDKRKRCKFSVSQGRCKKTFLFFSGVGHESEKVNALGYFQRVAHDNFRETRNQLQISNSCKSPQSVLCKGAPAFKL